jgi:hypothetical protein
VCCSSLSSSKRSPSGELRGQRIGETLIVQQNLLRGAAGDGGWIPGIGGMLCGGEEGFDGVAGVDGALIEGIGDGELASFHSAAEAIEENAGSRDGAGESFALLWGEFGGAHGYRADGSGVGEAGNGEGRSFAN